MDDGQEQQGNYEERLREVFDSFDASGAGSLSPEELSELCRSLHLDDTAPVLQALLQDQDQDQDQDRLHARVDFERFKNALILLLSSPSSSSSRAQPPQREEETLWTPDSPEIQPKFVKGSKRYGRRSTPEFLQPVSDLSEVPNNNEEEQQQEEEEEEEGREDRYDSAVPRKRERWNTNETSPEEYEAEGQMRPWNPDEPSAPGGSEAPPASSPEERLRQTCSERGVSWTGSAGGAELLALSEHLGLELNPDLLQSLTGEGVMRVPEFVSSVLNDSEESASAPHGQLRRHHRTQPFDEGGRRTAAPCAPPGTAGTRLFSALDDGTGFTPAEWILDAWLDEGIQNGSEILQALNFELEGKLSLGDLAAALENELLVSGCGIHQAAVASFKAEMRYLLEQVDREVKEKRKILSDLEKAEKLKNQLAAEVDEHHSAIEQKNRLNLRKLERDHKEKLAAVRSELVEEMEQLRQQAGLQRRELEAEVRKIREDESFLRDHLSISVKDNRRLEMELLDSTERLMEAESQVAKLQTGLDNVMKARLGDLDPDGADLYLREERMKELCAGYKAQYREMQDRIDELQAELRAVHSLGPVPHATGQALSEELESKSPGVESDPGIGSEEVQPFSLSLEAEMMLEQLKEQHLQEIEDLRNQLKSKINEFDVMVGKHGVAHEGQEAALALQHQQELQALKVEMARVQSHAEQLQSQLEQVELERRQAEEREAPEKKREEDLRSLREQLSEARSDAAHLEEQLSVLKSRLEEKNEDHLVQMEGLRKRHADEREGLERRQAQLSEEKAGTEKLLDHLRREREEMRESQEEELRARLEEAEARAAQRLTEQWREEKARLDREQSERLQELLEEEMLRLLREQEEREIRLREQRESGVAELQQRQEETFLQREAGLQERWERERLRLEEDYEGRLQEKLREEREKLQADVREQEKRRELLTAQVTAGHREALRELTAKHAEEREALSSSLDRLRDDIAKERRDVELSFTRRLREAEDRFSGDQDWVQEGLRAEVLKLEQHHQWELQALSWSHTEQKLLLDGQIQEALQKAEEQRRTTEETMARERERLDQRWREEMRRREGQHEKIVEEAARENQRLKAELDELGRTAQRAELELSRQLNQLHDSLETRDELLAQARRKAREAELLLQQTQEELLKSRAELEAQKAEARSLSERLELRGQCDGWRTKVRELEALLQQAAADFYLERKELREQVSVLEERLGIDPGSGPGEPPAGPALSPAGEASGKEPVLLLLLDGDGRVKAADPLADGASGGPGGPAEPASCKGLDPGSSGPAGNADKGRESSGDDGAREAESRPQGVPVVVAENVSRDEGEDLGTVGDPDGPAPPEVRVSPTRPEVAPLSFADGPLLGPRAAEENVLLLEKISLLQQKTEILEKLLDRDGEKIREGGRLLEENHGLKVGILLLRGRVEELEPEASRAAELRGRYEDCLRDNARLTRLNGELEKRLERLGRGGRGEDGDTKVSALLGELERQREALPARPDPPLQAEVKGRADELQDCCAELEKGNAGLRRAIWALRGESRTLHQTTQAQRSEAGRLADENQLLRQKIAALKEQDLREAHRELTQQLERLTQTKMAAQWEAETFGEQVSRLRGQSQQLAEQNRALAEKDARNVAETEALQRQLAELMEEGRKRGTAPKEDKSQLVACVSALEAELRKALEDAAGMEERNAQLSQQLSVLGEKVATVEESLRASNQQNGCLKADLRDLRRERDLFKHDAAVLRKQLQNASDKNRILEKRWSGPSKKRHRDELSRLTEQDQQLLRQENERLQAEVRRGREDLLQSREMARQLEARVRSPRQQSQSSAARALELENAALRRELEAREEGAGRGQEQLESLRQENEALKLQMTRLSSQLLDTLQAQFVGFLPPASPHRTPRAQNRGADEDDAQEERMRRMKEVEPSLRNLKLLLREKDAHLKEQLQKNGKAEVLIGDLHEENARLLRALEVAEQRQKIAEKKNYLLEEKISSLNKIVCDLSPSPLSSLSYQYKCS